MNEKEKREDRFKQKAAEIEIIFVPECKSCSKKRPRCKCDPATREFTKHQK